MVVNGIQSQFSPAARAPARSAPLIRAAFLRRRTLVGMAAALAPPTTRPVAGVKRTPPTVPAPARARSIPPRAAIPAVIQLGSWSTATREDHGTESVDEQALEFVCDEFLYFQEFC